MKRSTAVAVAALPLLVGAHLAAAPQASALGGNKTQIVTVRNPKLKTLIRGYGDGSGSAVQVLAVSGSVDHGKISLKVGRRTLTYGNSYYTAHDWGVNLGKQRDVRGAELWRVLGPVTVYELAGALAAYGQRLAPANSVDPQQLIGQFLRSLGFSKKELEGAGVSPWISVQERDRRSELARTKYFSSAGRQRDKKNKRTP
ncbi:MAG: hypothetical protein IT371_15680 [Deltaproteobacteria bacterium]|nr:hypothetical protein [Deltaproteobacteria bacterium]